MGGRLRRPPMLCREVVSAGSHLRAGLQTHHGPGGTTGHHGSRRPAAPRPDRVRTRRRHALYGGRPQAQALVDATAHRERPRAPDVTILVDHYDEDWDRLWWIRLRGRARVLDHGDERERERERALALLQEKYPQYRAEPPDGAVLAVDVTEVLEWDGST